MTILQNNNKYLYLTYGLHFIKTYTIKDAVVQFSAAFIWHLSGLQANPICLPVGIYFYSDYFY